MNQSDCDDITKRVPEADAGISLRQAQLTVDEWITTVGKGYFSVLTNMAVLAEEVGEVASVIARRYGDQTAKPGDSDDLADELADVLWVVMALANQTGVDLSQALLNNLHKKNIRDKERHRGTNRPSPSPEKP